ncbi:MAG: phosphoadenylyl-sulfate reductase [Chitinophagaceae bacterium]|nr:MAG: phosphoadenylyl-sulfate reductase [Chitinophagaceae bacterium]
MSVQEKINLQDLSHQISGLDLPASLSSLAKQFQGKTVFSSSFSYEDQVISHEILSNAIPIDIFTLDTGRLFPETYAVWNSTNDRYHTKVRAYYPQAEAVENFVASHGPNSFYTSLQNRKDCCHLRKVAPLKRALAGRELWVTGLRAEHSANREDLQQLEWDDINQVIKYHPLLNWSTEMVVNHIRRHNIPYNSLHDKGFVSIGCAPCTRAIQPGEDFRAGRWWWEDADKKECGLHASN